MIVTGDTGEVVECEVGKESMPIVRDGDQIIAGDALTSGPIPPPMTLSDSSLSMKSGHIYWMSAREYMPASVSG